MSLQNYRLYRPFLEEEAPFAFAFEPGRFLEDEEAPSVEVLGVDALVSLTTILACISSSFAALTFFGQKSVTKLLVQSSVP